MKMSKFSNRGASTGSKTKAEMSTTVYPFSNRGTSTGSKTYAVEIAA